MGRRSTSTRTAPPSRQPSTGLRRRSRVRTHCAGQRRWRRIQHRWRRDVELRCRPSDPRTSEHRVLPRRGEDPTIIVQSGDNNWIVSSDGGRTWETQDYRGGDNGPSFADPRQPDRLYVVAGRSGTGAVFLYTADAGDVPDASWGTDDRVVVPSPAPPAGESRGRWNVWARNFQLGYRPLVLDTGRRLTASRR